MFLFYRHNINEILLKVALCFIGAALLSLFCCECYAVLFIFIFVCLGCKESIVLPYLVIYLYYKTIFNADWFYIVCHISFERYTFN